MHISVAPTPPVTEIPALLRQTRELVEAAQAAARSSVDASIIEARRLVEATTPLLDRARTIADAPWGARWALEGVRILNAAAVSKATAVLAQPAELRAPLLASLQGQLELIHARIVAGEDSLRHPNPIA